jgi:hypothetical protein
MEKFVSDHSALPTLSELDAAQWRRPVTPQGCAIITAHQKEYLQITRDNPNVVWLYTLMLQEGIGLTGGEVISGMKQRILEEGSLGPLAWRYIANGTADDFRVVLDSRNPGDGDPRWHWKALVAWLKVLSGLRLRSPVPEPIQELFLHDGLVADLDNGEVQFRGAWMRFDTLRHKSEWLQEHCGSLPRQNWSK